ncbi:adenylate/guanylate cyclase domain-containing protein [Magnetospirillum sp. 15-1]|uniref:adenylate/guanylate cyclase domain-containing protein n=1 Tax=Magnetospirillum sp. 15-1 TaxID=1979370 RepID=UPI000BBBDAC5|nr:adenylate/guanylate cyclase domain-containing protein [Magnetospirillum sp. 15-1]
MIIVHFEVYVMEGRGWMLHARFPRLERDEAVREAKELESTLGVRTKVLRETYNTDTNVFDEAEVYLSGHNVQVKKIAAAGRGAAGGGGRAGGRERDSGKGGNAARTAAARRAAKARASGPSMGAGAAILRLTVILLVASGLGLGALRMVPSAVVFLYDYGYRVTPDEYGQLLMVVFGLVFLMTAVPLGLRFMPRNANIQFNRSTSVAAPPPRPQPSEAVKKSLNKLAKKAEAEMIPETWGDDPEPEPEPTPPPPAEEEPPPFPAAPAEEPSPEAAAVESLPTTPVLEATKKVTGRFVDKSMEIIRQVAPSTDKYTTFGLNLFMAGAVQTIARTQKLDSGGQRKLLKSILEKLGTPGDHAAIFYDKVPEYISEQRYARMFDSGKSAMESWSEGDEGTPMIKLQTSLKDWNKPATEKKPSIMTVMFTDMVGSTDLTQARGDQAAQEIVRKHNAIVRTALTQFAGHEVKHTGDGIMASFASAANAVEATVQIQRQVTAHNEKQPNLPLHLRIGLNAGEPIQEEDDLFGSTVQLAARVCAATQSDQTLCTQVVKDLAAGKGSFTDGGMHALKGFRDKFQLWEVLWR